MTGSSSPALPPAQPTYVLRGHTAQIHAVHFFRQNLRLLSGDADGWIVVWDVPIRRPVTVWKAHSASILGIGSWGDDRIITHGRDNKLLVWSLRQGDESTFSAVLPIDDAVTERRQPWLLHSIAVNALNFCSFAMCEQILPAGMQSTTDEPASILIAMPGVQDGWINVIKFPGEDRVATIPGPKDTSTGMIMAIGLSHERETLTVLAGYESGHAVVWRQHSPSKAWQIAYMSKSHTQPVLSLAATPDRSCFYTSSADAIIARHPLASVNTSVSMVVQTKHAGQQSLSVRSDGRIFATAGWDGRLRTYSTKTLKELAVLKWHKDGCYALAFAELQDTGNRGIEQTDMAAKHNLMVSEQRTAKTKSTHWIAAGSKDGKVSLWDVY